ncbi:MAG TPA: roadblock/LC7 domain-containing protein [Acidimicrobiales bacterium]|nr:roadblock/LC7 domain-containing protein [Acidimicrobiales bacterium]
MSDTSASANLDWMISTFVNKVPGIQDAVVVSSDGLLLALSPHMQRAGADRFAAVASGLIGLAYGAVGPLGGGRVNEIIVEMEEAFLLVTSISDGSCFAVCASAQCDIGLVGYEMALFVRRAGAMLTPALRAELQRALPT